MGGREGGGGGEAEEGLEGPQPRPAAGPLIDLVLEDNTICRKRGLYRVGLGVGNEGEARIRQFHHLLRKHRH